MWDGFNKRKFPRLNLQCEITIRSEGKKSPISAVTENLGIGGVCVILDQPLERFSQCLIRLELDRELPKLEGQGKIVWAIPTSDPITHKKRFDVGIEFVDFEPASHDVIRKFIEKITQKGFREIPT